jgi:nucleoside-diphosphate-sugar epimerase
MIGILEDIAGITVTKNHDLTAPQGVRGRNSDNTMFHETYGWEPSISLRDGLERTYAWIYDQLSSRAPR